jgi:hypothetical protein
MGYFCKTDNHLARQDILRSLWYPKVHYHTFHHAFCTIHVCQVIVYNLVRHYAHSDTVKIYSDMFRWRHYHLQGRQYQNPKNPVSRRSLSCHALTDLFRGLLQHRACLHHHSHVCTGCRPTDGQMSKEPASANTLDILE